MTADSMAFRVVFVALAGLVNRQQQQVLEYLVDENRVLKEQLNGRRLRLTHDQHRRLAAKGKRVLVPAAARPQGRTVRTAMPRLTQVIQSS